MATRKQGRGFTVVELAAVIAAVVSAVMLIWVAFVALRPARPTGQRSMRDASQLRGVLQGMVIWAQNNRDQYPLPSLLDVNNDTVPEQGPAKDTSANIFSILLFHGFIPADILVSWAEANRNIRAMEGYALDNPPAAANPAKALWDPSFNADFTGPRPGNLSYAHAIPRGMRNGSPMWSNTFVATDPIIANRGPQISGVTADGRGGFKPNYVNPPSNTFLIHGSRDRWEGNVGYNDNHVQFETTDLDPRVTYTLPGGGAWPDYMFFDEPDDAGATNAFMGIFIKAGAGRKDFSAIWD